MFATFASAGQEEIARGEAPLSQQDKPFLVQEITKCLVNAHHDYMYMLEYGDYCVQVLHHFLYEDPDQIENMHSSGMRGNPWWSKNDSYDNALRRGELSTAKNLLRRAASITEDDIRKRINEKIARSGNPLSEEHKSFLIQDMTQCMISYPHFDNNRIVCILMSEYIYGDADEPKVRPASSGV